MFEKLILREADSHSRDLPGDKALNFSIQQEANLTEFERARLQPPSVAQLYEQMHRDGIRPRDNCLRILVANAQSLETAHRYLNDSDEDHKTLRILFQDDPDPQSLKTIEISLFAAYIQALTQRNKRVAKNMMRAIRMARSRVGPERSPVAQLIWGSILKNLSQHHGALKISLSQQFKLLFHAIEQMSGRDGIPLAAFIQFSKCIRKAARWELSQLFTELASDELAAARNPLLRLYSHSHHGPEETDQLAEAPRGRTALPEHGSESQSPNTLFRMGAARMKELYNILKLQEHQSQRLFSGHQVAVLDRMMWRKDTARSDHAHEYMLSLAYVGEFEEMATVLKGLIEEWGQPDVVEALLELNEPPAYADFFEVLCAFRLLAEPMLEPSVVEPLQEAIGSAGLNWAWPDGEAMKTYVDMQDDESISTLARVLVWIRMRRYEEVKGSSGYVLGGDLA
ncbi:hypothetical protein PT974_04089 [Cladobotryum mycophilum]|uniref:Uncharacterized protein n=1 Tax=Cladobotryum mycophilum TaxID=491253 RepID=A0ABR0SUS7_9HYPO